MIMALLVFLALFLSLTGYSSATYCLCRDDVGTGAWQKTIDYACGAGADCRPILQNGACFQPNTVKAHCDYAANSYFQNKGQTAGSCDFAGTAAPSNNPPSTVGTGCTYPTSATQVTPSTGIPTSTPGTTTGGTTTGTPGSTTTGIFSPIGLGPTGITDANPSGVRSLLHNFSLILTLFLSGLSALWG